MAVSDKRGSPTYTVDFARNLMTLVESGHYGTYHLANHGTCTRDEIARKIAAIMGIDAVVEPVPSSYFPLPAHRPDSECLSNYKLGLLGLDRMPNWENSLEAYVKARDLDRSNYLALRGKDFLTSDHTARHCRELWLSRVFRTESIRSGGWAGDERALLVR